MAATIVLSALAVGGLYIVAILATDVWRGDTVKEKKGANHCQTMVEISV